MMAKAPKMIAAITPVEGDHESQHFGFEPASHVVTVFVFDVQQTMLGNVEL